jgi:hypothetical protein
MECRYCRCEWDRELETEQPLSIPFPCYNCSLELLAETISVLEGEVYEIMEESGRSYDP